MTEHKEHQAVTSCIVHLADSANFKGVTFNKLCVGLKGSCFESPNDTIHVTVVRNMKNMATWKKILIIVSSIIIVLIVGGLFLVNQFFSAFAPPKIKITTEYISTNRDFINGLTIEKIRVDSMGQNGTPVKYTVFYWTSCSIDHPEGRPPDPPNKIYFDKKGKYWWTEENVDLKYIHKGLRRESLNKMNRIQASIGDKKFSTCPIDFQKEQWYFIRTYDPQVTGIFFFIDKDGEEHQYYLASGVSPI